MGKYRKEANMIRSAALRDCVRMSCTVSNRNNTPATTATNAEIRPEILNSNGSRLSGINSSVYVII